jgi:hypothetical protein
LNAACQVFIVCRILFGSGQDPSRPFEMTIATCHSIPSRDLRLEGSTRGAERVMADEAQTHCPALETALQQPGLRDIYEIPTERRMGWQIAI